MAKIFTTVVIPSVGDVESSPIVQSFLNAKPQDIYVQFVFLLNKKNHLTETKSNIEKFDDYEIIIAANDRYFGSCEENLYRASDFSDLFFDYVFCVGEHDFIDWTELVQAVERCREHGLGVMGWNLKIQQEKSCGGYAEMPAIVALNSRSTANEYCQILLNKGVLKSTVAYPALISIYGPIDWAAYLGTHLFTKEVFKKVFQYKFSEQVYSFVYKQFLLFATNEIRYGFYENSPIWRISDDFLKIRENRISGGWLEEHRTVAGLSKCFSIANLQHLVEIKNPVIYNLISNSFCLSQRPSETNEDIQLVHTSVFTQILNWSMQVVSHKLDGNSFYFGARSRSGSVSDLFTISEYLRVMLAQVRSNEIYMPHRGEFLQTLKTLACFLNDYLSATCASDLLLNLCLNHLDRLRNLLDQKDLVSMNQDFFCDYTTHLQRT